MEIRNLLFGLVLAAAVSNVVILILIMAVLDRRGQKTSMLLARIYTFRYVSAYKEATQKETGKPGPLYGLWIATIILTLGLAVAAVLVSRL